jgi:hypothetical protein
MSNASPSQPCKGGLIAEPPDVIHDDPGHGGAHENEQADQHALLSGSPVADSA